MLALVLAKLVACENLANSMFNKINDYRATAGLKHLKSIRNLENAARDQALYMCENSTLTHLNTAGDLAERGKRNGFNGASIGENIAKSYNDSYDDVAKRWIESVKHKKNIMGDFNYTGVATCLDKNGSRFWVQVFGLDKDGSRSESSDVSIDEKPEFQMLEYPNNLSRFKRDLMPETSFSTRPFCFKADECLQSQPQIPSLMQSVGPSEVSRPPCSSATSSVSKSISSIMSVVTLFKSIAPETLTVISTRNVYVTVPSISTFTITSTIENPKDVPEKTVTVTSTTETAPPEEETETVTVTRNQKKTVTHTKTSEVVVTVTRQPKKRVTSTVEVKKTVTVTETPRKVEPVRELESDEFLPNNDYVPMNVEPKMKFNENLTEPLNVKRFNAVVDVIPEVPQRNNSRMENLSPLKSMQENNKDRKPYELQDRNDNKDWESTMKEMLSGKRQYYRNACGTPSNPCIRTLIVRG